MERARVLSDSLVNAILVGLALTIGLQQMKERERERERNMIEKYDLLHSQKTVYEQ